MNYLFLIYEDGELAKVTFSSDFDPRDGRSRKKIPINTQGIIDSILREYDAMLKNLPSD